MSTDNWLSNQYQFIPNLEAYFARINYTGTADVSYETLKEIQWNHLLTIPFENIDIHMSREVDLTPTAIENKIVHQGRGGYCFEQNIYLLHVLRAIGFDVTPILARTRWQRPTDIVNPATHLVLQVKYDMMLYLFDVGFSSFGSPIPLAIQSPVVQTTPLETRRIIKEKAGYVHQMQLDDNWHDVYIFTLNESYPYDWDVGSYWVSHAPTSVCVNNMIVSMPTTTCRYLLRNKTLKTTYLNGETESVEIQSEEELFDVLRKYFKLTFPDDTKISIPNTTW